METKTVRTFCRVCEPACGLVAEVTGEKLVRLTPDREHPISRGFACHKGLFGVDIHHDPDRVNHPLRRNARGEFVRVGWDDAIGEIAARLTDVRTRHGPDAIAGYLGNPGEYNALLPEAWYAFFAQLGASRVFNVNTQDCSNKFAAAEAVYGSVTIQPIPDFEHTDLLLLLGENPKVSQMSFASLPDAMGTLQRIVSRGGRVVFVNPRRVESAKALGEWLPIQPDTDVYFLAGLLCELERQGCFDEAILAAHGRHVEELRTFVRQYPPARVSAVTGIPVATFEALATAIGRARGAAIHMSTGVNMGRQGTLAYWLLQMVSFVTGNLDRRGGNVLSVGYYTRRARAGRAPADGAQFMESRFGQLRRPRLPIFPLPGNLLPDLLADRESPIRALIVCAGNPLLSLGGEERLRACLPDLELLVSIDLYRNATGEYAHFVLPATDAFEREDINQLGLGMQARPNVQFTPAVVAPQFERRHERFILHAIARAMGLSVADDAPGAHPWSKFEHMLRSRGLSLDELRARGTVDLGPHAYGRFHDDHLQTADGRVDCCPSAFAAALTRLATEFHARASEPAGTLRLISKREARMMNSWYANVARLKTRAFADNPLHMHPADAAARGLADGARACIRNVHGEIEATIRHDADLVPGVVAMMHGWGQQQTHGMHVAQATPGVNCNRLLPTGPGSFDPLSGQAHMTGIPVEVAARMSG